MSKVAIEDTILDNIVDSVNKKTHGNDQMRPQDIPATVDGIKTEKPEQEKTVTVTKNGDTVVTPDTGKTLSKATVKVAVPSDKKPEVAGKETITQNGKQTFTPPAGSVYNSFEVTTNTPAPKPEQTKDYTITANGDTPITPDPGKVITGGTIHVDVLTGGGAPEAVSVEIYDNSEFGAGARCFYYVDKYGAGKYYDDKWAFPLKIESLKGSMLVFVNGGVENFVSSQTGVLNIKDNRRGREQGFILTGNARIGLGN